MTEPEILDDDQEVQLPVDECPRCHKVAELDGDSEAGIEFTQPICKKCREWCIQDFQMDDFDRAYERARANGWED